MSKKRRNRSEWHRLGIAVDVGNNDIATALEMASRRFFETTGLVDERGKYIRRPQITRGRRSSVKISVNSGLTQVADIPAKENRVSRNKIMSRLVARCLYDALRDLRLERQKLEKEWSKPCTDCDGTGLVEENGATGSCPRCEEIYRRTGINPKIIGDEIPF